MNKSKYIFLILIPLIFASCSEGISIFVKIFGLDSSSEKLEIGFDFERFVKNEKVSISNIQIYLNDTLSYEIVAKSRTITNWKFPELPNGFKIEYPKGVDKIKKFSKTDNIRFRFRGSGKYPALGSWNYKPQYSTKKYRWLFDNGGNKKIDIGCSYEPWIGKDIIKIVSNDSFEIDPKSFELNNQENEPVEFKLITKSNLTNRVALALKKKFKKGEKLFLSFKAHNGEKYEETIIVPSKSIVGIAGKYNDLK